MSIIRYLPLIVPLLVSATEPTRTPFTLRTTLPVGVSLLTPPAGATVSGPKVEDGAETFQVASATGGEPSIVIEVADRDRKVLWHHDYGFDESAVPGCSIAVDCHPTLPLLLIHWYGYKWNHVHTLLFVDSTDKKLRVLEYRASEADLTPLIRAANEQSKDFKYLYHPQSFTASGVTFECIPLQNGSGHPFAQDHRFWFTVSTDVSRDFKNTAKTAKPHE